MILIATIWKVCKIALPQFLKHLKIKQISHKVESPIYRRYIEEKKVVVKVTKISKIKYFLLYGFGNKLVPKVDISYTLKYIPISKKEQVML